MSWYREAFMQALEQVDEEWEQHEMAACGSIDHIKYTIKPVPRDQLPEGAEVKVTQHEDGDSLAAEAARAAGTVDIREHTLSQIGFDDSEDRKATPMATGLLDYFPAALAYVSQISKVGNDKHNPGEPMHHARGKSMDHADCILRHLADRGGTDEQGVLHSGYAAWRALALLQQELEDAGQAPLARGAKLPDEVVDTADPPSKPACGCGYFRTDCLGQSLAPGYRCERDDA